MRRRAHPLRASRRAAGLAIAALGVLLAAGAGGAAPSGPLLAFGFDEGFGATVRDLSGGGHDGAIRGAVWTAAGKNAGALQFDGIDDWVTVADSAALDLTTGMTLEAWVYPTGGSSWRTVVLKERGAAGMSYALYAQTGSSGPSGHVQIGSSQPRARWSTRAASNTWSHVAATHDGATVRLYVNGVLRASAPAAGSIAVSASPLRIGGNAVWAEWFGGRIDDLLIYDRALTPAEIQADMGSAVTPPDSTPPTTPTALVIVGKTTTSLTLHWQASSDEDGIARYALFLDGAPVGSATMPPAVFGRLSCGTTHELGVEAVDRAGNRSGRALLSATTTGCDTQPPSAPTGLAQTGATEASATVEWLAASDNVGVTEYGLYVDGAPAGTTTATSATVALPCGATRTFGVDAADARGNRSARSELAISAGSCDTAAPVVSVTAPADGATVSGLVEITVGAIDNTGVAGVQVRLDGVDLGAEDVTEPYTFLWDTATVTNGPHELTAVARDASGNRATSAATAVTVDNDRVSPTVRLTSPASGSVVTGTVTLVAEASDDRGVAGVRFRIDGTPIGTEDADAPYTFDWNSRTAASGPHVLTAVARDQFGNSTVSDAVGVTVSNALNVGDARKRVTVGPGYIDASIRSVVRTPADVVYVFAADDTPRRNATGPTVIHAWKGNRSGIPTAFAELDAANRPVGGAPDGVLGSPDARLDRNGTVHVIYMDEKRDSVVYRTFSTLTDRWGPQEVLDGDANIDYDGNFLKRETTNTLALDGNEVPHAVYKSGNSLVYRNRSGGTWSAPVVLETPPQGSPRHVQLANHADGSLHLAWHRSYTPDPSIAYRRRAPDGTWGPTEVVADDNVLGNESSDQGPSIVVGTSGEPRVLYVAAKHPNGVCCGSGVQTKVRRTTGWVADNPSENVFTHAPQIYGRGEDAYAFLGHDRHIAFGYVFHIAGRPGWDEYEELNDASETDGSASPRWDPVRETNPNVIDTAYYDENLFGDSRYLPEVYYMAVIPEGGTPPTDVQAPTTPTGLVQTAASTTSVTVSWSAASDDVAVAGYGRYLGGSPSGTTGSTTTTFSGLTCATAYLVGIDAYDDAGNRSGRATVTARTSDCTGPPPPPPPGNGLVAAYSFAEGTGSAVGDSSGQGNAGVISGAVWTAAGRNGSALSFDGVNDSVTIADADSLDLTNAMTLEAWVRPTVVTSWRTVILKEQPGDLVYALYANESGDRPGVHAYLGGDDRRATGAARLAANTWTHLAGTYDGATLRLYVNGAQAATQAHSGAMPVSSQPLKLGGNSVWSEWFAGQIDDVRIYRRVLTAAEIQADMGAPVG